MHLIKNEESAPLEPPFFGVPLSVVFAEGDVVEQARKRGGGSLQLEPPYHVSDEDSYLVLPLDIGMEVIDILADGDLELLHETMRDGLLVEGYLERQVHGMQLVAETVATPRSLLQGPFPYAASVSLGAEGDLLATINNLPHLQCTVLSSLMDDEGLDRTLREKEYVGPGWQVPAAALKNGGVDPTYVWSRRDNDRVGVELALFQEYEELVALLRPLELTA
ncbi:MAG: hypothetical protein AAGF12_18105 [Myxococcota bacterium]